MRLKALLFVFSILGAGVLNGALAQEITPDYSNLNYDMESHTLLDIYLPEGDSATYPVVVFIHGGGFSGGDKAGSASQNMIYSQLAGRGFAVVAINYLLGYSKPGRKGNSVSSETKEGFPEGGKFSPLLNEVIREASSDAVAALKWIGKNGKTYRLDKNNVVLCGGSAGAITCLYTAYCSKVKGVTIKGVVNLWGAIDNVEKIRNRSIPMLTIHGDKDDLVNVAYAHAIDQRMKDLGSSKSSTIILKGKGHAQYKLIAAKYMDEVETFIRSVTE